MVKKDENKVINIKKETLKDLNFNGVITKIKLNKDNIPEIHYKLITDMLGADIIVEGKDRANNDFTKAIQALLDIFCDITELECKKDNIIITVVNFKKNGVVISGQIELTQNGIPVPLFINTPFILINNEKGGYELPKYAQNQLEELQRQAILYIKGKSKQIQLDLFDNKTMA